ncbi:hypothetical protein NDU88_005094 [Pleurodeles waltl]|uniref:Uncharacterized protein n=1 Tax=Pleurodeles waltl TaxID=8319 RepID=A0AAV7VLN4_PLEWA|nr:hypothetical protein NDU88_005094 [Pleurodeles waltl]
MQPPEAAHERQHRWDLREPRIGGPGGGEINNPATLWGERGLSRDTKDSDQLHPEALSALSNQGQHPERTGLHSASRDAYWRSSKNEEEESPGTQENECDQREPLGRADDSSGCSHQKQPMRDNAGGIFANPGLEDQEAEKSTIRPRSWESTALAGGDDLRTASPRLLFQWRLGKQEDKARW